MVVATLGSTTAAPTEAVKVAHINIDDKEKISVPELQGSAVAAVEWPRPTATIGTKRDM